MTLSERAALHGMGVAEYVALCAEQRTVANKAKGAAFTRKVDVSVAAGRAYDAMRQARHRRLIAALA